MSYNLGNEGYYSDFHGDESFTNQYSDQTRDAFDDSRLTCHRKNCVVQEKRQLLDQHSVNREDYVCKDCLKMGLFW